jgi:hypothetical protein
VVPACNPSTQKAETGKLGVWGKLGLYSKTLSQKKKKKEKKVHYLTNYGYVVMYI